MFVILFYDVNEKRCNKALKTCRKYLQWVQNSVFEGEITEAGYEKMIFELQSIIKKEDNDSVVAYKFRHMKYYDRKVYGIDKKGETQFL
jgi:CRISPR-associated protein Cas2